MALRANRSANVNILSKFSFAPHELSHSVSSERQKQNRRAVKQQICEAAKPCQSFSASQLCQNRKNAEQRNHLLLKAWT